MRILQAAAIPRNPPHLPYKEVAGSIGHRPLLESLQSGSISWASAPDSSPVPEIGGCGFPGTGTILRRPRARGICASVKGYAARVTTGSKHEQQTKLSRPISSSQKRRDRFRERTRLLKGYPSACPMQENECRGVRFVGNKAKEGVWRSRLFHHYCK